MKTKHINLYFISCGIVKFSKVKLKVRTVIWAVSNALYIWALKRGNRVVARGRIKTFHISYPWGFVCLFWTKLITRLVFQ